MDGVEARNSYGEGDKLKREGQRKEELAYMELKRRSACRSHFSFFSLASREARRGGS